MDNRVFWIGVAERAGKTFAQALLAALAVSSGPLDVLHTNWVGALSVALGATLLSGLTSLSSWNVGLAETPAAEAARAPARHAALAHSAVAEHVDEPDLGDPEHAALHGSQMGEAAATPTTA